MFHFVCQCVGWSVGNTFQVLMDIGVLDPGDHFFLGGGVTISGTLEFFLNTTILQCKIQEQGLLFDHPLKEGWSYVSLCLSVGQMVTLFRF